MPVSTYLLRIWLPDRPGALGAVASRIGSVGADVVGIEVLEQGAGRAIDELVLRIPNEERIGLLLTELAEVDGVAVEDLRAVSGNRADRVVDLLDAAFSVVNRQTDDPVVQLLQSLQCSFDLDWVAVVDADADRPPVVEGDAPAPEWLHGYATSVRGGELVQAASDVVHAPLVDFEGSMLLACRERYELRDAERRELTALARICGETLHRRS